MLPKLISIFLKAMLADLTFSLGLIFWGPTASPFSAVKSLCHVL